MNTREKGTVLWFNNAKGFGYINRNRDNKHLLVRWKNIRGEEAYRSLEEGQHVEFSTIRDEKNMERVTDVVDENESQYRYLTELFELSIKVIELSGLDLGTICYYLNKAITEDCDTFNCSLDVLYQPESNTNYLEVIDALKLLHDLYLNNSIRPLGSAGLPNPRAINHFLKPFGDIQSQTVTDFIKNEIHKKMAVWRQDREQDITDQEAARKLMETSLKPNIEWRKILNLPSAQLESKPFKTMKHVELMKFDYDLFTEISLSTRFLENHSITSESKISPLRRFSMCQNRSDSRTGEQASTQELKDTSAQHKTQSKK